MCARASVPLCSRTQQHPGGVNYNKPLPPFIPVLPPQSTFAPSIFNRPESVMTDVSRVSYGQAREQRIKHGAIYLGGTSKGYDPARGPAGVPANPSPPQYGAPPPRSPASTPPPRSPGGTVGNPLQRRPRTQLDADAQQQTRQRVTARQWAVHRDRNPDCSCTRCRVHREHGV